MAAALRGSRLLSAARPLLTLLAVLAIAGTAGGCLRSPRFQAPFTLANPNERHPIAVKQGESTLDLVVSRGSTGLNSSQKTALGSFLRDYKTQGPQGLLIKAPSGGANERSAMRAYDDIRYLMGRAGINPKDVRLEPYFANGDPAAPLRLSYLQYVAEPPDCPDWSENVARDPQNMPWPNMGCATQRNFAAVIANPEDLLHPRAETPRPSERRDVVWGKYVAGQPTLSKRDPSEHANTSDISVIGGGS